MNYSELVLFQRMGCVRNAALKQKRRNAVKKHFRRGALRAFSLIEVIISVAILAVLMIAFLQVQASSYATSRRAERRTSALEVARQLMEETMDLQYADAIAVDQDGGISTTGYAFKISVTEIALDMLQIEINVARLKQSMSPVAIGAMSMNMFRGLDVHDGCRLRLVCMKTQT